VSDDATGWFEPLYSAARSGTRSVPWDRGTVHPLLAAWTAGRDLRGAGRRALVIGAGLGFDAEHLASLGFATTAFDVAPTAVAMARERFGGSAVDYRVADLLDLPREWSGAFDLVVEIITVQALPEDLRASATAAIASTVAPGGTLFVVSGIRDGAPEPGPPWPLTRAQVEAFAAGELELVRLDRAPIPGAPGERRWLAELTRPAE
jgi:SAM-dependent methyltransferase